MFDVGLGELLLLALIALVVLGPEKLPHAARMAGAWVGRIRRSVIAVQVELEQEVAAAELRERILKEQARVASERTESPPTAKPTTATPPTHTPSDPTP